MSGSCAACLETLKAVVVTEIGLSAEGNIRVSKAAMSRKCEYLLKIFNSVLADAYARVGYRRIRRQV